MNALPEEEFRLEHIISQSYKSTQNFCALHRDCYASLDLDKFVKTNSDLVKIRVLLENHTICELEKEKLHMLIGHYMQLAQAKKFAFDFDLYQVFNRATLEQLEYL